jgi:hypothetical protein
MGVSGGIAILFLQQCYYLLYYHYRFRVIDGSNGCLVLPERATLR